MRLFKNGCCLTNRLLYGRKIILINFNALIFKNSKFT